MLFRSSVSYDYSARSYGTFSISAVPADGVKPEIFEKMLDAAVTKAVKEINVQEIDRTKQKMLAGLVYLRDNPEDAAYIAGMMAAVGFSAEEIDNIDAKIQAVDALEVREAANKLFEATSVGGWLLPEKEVK